MKIPCFYLIAALLANWMLSLVATAQVPQLVHYQGRIVVESVNFDGVGFFKFALVDQAGTIAYWTNDGTHLDGSEPDASVTLTVNKGLYSVLLGDATLQNMQIVPATVFANPSVHLRVWFNDGQHGFQLLTPDQRIAAVGYAIMAGTAQTVSDGAITSAKISPGAVGSAQIADGAVGNTKLANSSITLDVGPGLVGGGTTALGGTILLSNGGVTSLQGGGGITVSSATGSITLGSNATPTSLPESLVTRDANGGFSAGTVNAAEFVGGGVGLTGVAGTLRWENVSGLTQQALPNTGYLASNAAQMTVTLPATASPGDVIRVSGVGAGGWAIVPNAGQNVVGFGVGEGPAGSQGATGAVQFIGNDTWQPMNESLIATGAVGSAQLASSITLGGTISAANFIGNGQGLTDLSAASLSTGTLADTVLSANVPRLDAENNSFTGTLLASGTLDVSNATVIGFDKISRSDANTWTGAQTFANVKVSATEPHMSFQNPTSVGTIGLATDFSDSGHDFFTMGINMRAVAHAGFEIVQPLESAWGLALERDFFNGETVQHEAYFTDGGSFRPFVFVYSQAATADVVSIENGVVTISQAQVSDYLIPDLRFQFTNLSDNSGVSANTFYRVKTVLSPTTFTFMGVLGGQAINATASGGSMKRGGWGNAGYRVPLAIHCDNYDNYDVAGGTALQVVNTKPDYQTLVRFDNFAGNGVVLQLDEKWRLGTDLVGDGDGNFYLMNLNGGLNDSVIQVDPSSRMAIGYKRSEDGYVPHTNSGTLDVNGPIVATRPALPASVVEGGFIVVDGTAYIGSGGVWRALSFAP